MSQAMKLNQVLMQDSYCVNAFEKEVAYLLKYDPEKLLAGFYENAGLTVKKMRYPCWENMLIGGHTLGHFLTAAAQAYANAQASKEQKEALFSLMKALIDGLLVCQEHSQGKSGFVFGAVIQDQNNVELQFDYVEQNKTNIITEAWVPWYTMHKLLDGIVNMYELTGYEPALTLASGIGDWAYNRASGWSEEIHRVVLGIEYGGMNDALYELYRCSGKAEHLQVAHMFDEESLFKEVASGKTNALTNRHANTTIPKFVGALNRYLVLGDEAEEYLTYVEKFWDMVVDKHTYITGGNSEWEHFGEDYVLDAERTNCNNETCNTYNMLKMTRKLFMVTGKRKYADYYENTLINAILSSQNPETGMTMYFQPMATGYFKVYGTEFDKFWCCTGSGMENFTKLNDSIYFCAKNELITNLYLASEVKVLGMTVKQEADFPRKDTATFTISCDAAVEAQLTFRIPDWAFGYQVSINGVKVTAEEQEGYIHIRRVWNNQDIISLTFEMKVMAYGLPDCDNVFAFKYGPLLLSADLGFEDMVDGKTGVDVTIPANKKVSNEYLTIDQGSIPEYIREIDKHFDRDLEELRFTLLDTDQTITFHPHYLKTRERYGIYWYFLDRNENQEELIEKKRKEELRRERIIDTVQPGYGQYENDELHDFVDKGSVGATNEGTTRYATPGGSFGYHMKVVSGRNHVLEMHLLREDNGKLLRVLVGEEELFSKRLHYTGRENEYIVEIPLSKELIAANLEKRSVADTIFIRFEGGRFVESARLASFLYMLTQ